MHDHFRIARRTFEWADTARRQIKENTDDFFGRVELVKMKRPFPDTGMEEVYIKQTAVFPKDDIDKSVIDALRNTKEALDQTTSSIINIYDPDRRQTPNFPWCDNKSALVKKLARGRFPKEVANLYDEFLPYPDPEKEMRVSRICKAMSNATNRKHDYGVELKVQTGPYVVANMSGFVPLFRGTQKFEGPLSPIFDMNGEAVIFRQPIGTNLNYDFSISALVVFDRLNFSEEIDAIELVDVFYYRAKEYFDAAVELAKKARP